MKSQFNSKMSSSPFYVGPSVYVNKSSWSFSKKQNSIYKYLFILFILAFISAIIAV